MTEKELKELKKKIANLYVGLLPSAQYVLFKFSDRKRVVNKYEEWLKYRPVKNCPESFIAWMFKMGYLRLDKIMEDLEQDDEKETLEWRTRNMRVDYNKLGAICELLRGWLPNYELRFMFPFEQDCVKIKLIGDKVYDFTVMIAYLNSHNEHEIAEYIYDKMAINVK